MFISAYWHGIHSGYYMGMVSTTPCILAENAMEAGIRRRIPAHSRWIRLYDVCSWFFRTRMFDYMSIGFILKYFHYTWKYWSSVYFIGHVVTLIFYIIGVIAIRIRAKHEKTKSNEISDFDLNQQSNISDEQDNQSRKDR
jgi:lysophospholipid acyltransferase 7